MLFIKYCRSLNFKDKRISKEAKVSFRQFCPIETQCRSLHDLTTSSTHREREKGRS